MKKRDTLFQEWVKNPTTENENRWQKNVRNETTSMKGKA